MSTPRLIFVCWGNICRSPMAERMARAYADEHGIEAEITSAGTSREELGSPIDRRAAEVLRSVGIDADGHRAHQITADEIERADLVVAAEQIHIDKMRALVPDADNLVLISEFDPQAAPGDPLPDPWYGDAAGFNDTFTAIERALPGVFDRLEEGPVGDPRSST